MKNISKVNNLKIMAQFALFVTSYLPLFILVIFRQIYENQNIIRQFDFSTEEILLIFQKFGLSAFLIIVVR